VNFHEISHIRLNHGLKETQTRKCLVNVVLNRFRCVMWRWIRYYIHISSLITTSVNAQWFQNRSQKSKVYLVNLLDFEIQMSMAEFKSYFLHSDIRQLQTSRCFTNKIFQRVHNLLQRFISSINKLIISCWKLWTCMKSSIAGLIMARRKHKQENL